jgi:DNA modification methylase
VGEINVVLCGDSAEVLRGYPDAFFDSVVCDPPYGLSKEPNIAEVLTKWVAGETYDHGHGGFMGKAWDSFVPHPDLWREVFRVLKPGGHALVFAGTRTQDLMTIALRLGGFEIRDVIEWLYFSGFPKSMDVGKAFDRRRTEDLGANAKVARFIVDAMEREGKTRSDICAHFNAENIAQQWTTYWTDGAVKPRVPKLDQWAELKEILSLSDEMDAEVWRLNGRKGKPGDSWADREFIEHKSTGLGQVGYANDGIDASGGLYKKEFDLTAPAPELARKWDGWGTTLKPAHEPIIVARKPLGGTVAETVEKFGTGAINIDGCRIGEGLGVIRERKASSEFGQSSGWNEHKNTNTVYDGTAGRFPANCITLDENAFYSPYFNVTPREVCKKASKADRNANWMGNEVEGEVKTSGTHNSVGRDMTNPRNAMGAGERARIERGEPAQIPQKNNHPTVKPIALMAWLIRLVTPPGGVVLDPFAGSGTTPVAAKREGFGYVGIEREQEYVDIAIARTKEAV